MADEKPAAAAAPAEATPDLGAGKGGSSKKQSFILLVLAVVNMVVILAVGMMIWQGKKKDAAEPKIEHVIKGEVETEEKEKKEEKEISEKVVPLETFIINLNGSKGRRVAKVNIEISLEGDGVNAEVEQRKAQIRDIIIIILSSKSYEQVSNKEGKDKLKEQIKDTVNSFLTKGRIKEVYFTEFIYS